MRMGLQISRATLKAKCDMNIINSQKCTCSGGAGHELRVAKDEYEPRQLFTSNSEQNVKST